MINFLINRFSKIGLLILISFNINAQSNLNQPEKKISFNFGLKVQSLNVSVTENPNFEFYVLNYPNQFFEGLPKSKEISNSPYILGIQVLDIKFGNWLINRSAIGFDVVNFKYDTELYGMNLGVGRSGLIWKKLSYQAMINYHIGFGIYEDDVQFYECTDLNNNQMYCYARTRGESSSDKSTVPSLLEFNLGLNFKLTSKEKDSYPYLSIFGGYNIVNGKFTFTRDASTLPSPPPGFMWVTSPGAYTINQVIEDEFLRYNINLKNHFFFGVGLFFNLSMQN